MTKFVILTKNDTSRNGLLKDHSDVLEHNRPTAIRMLKSRFPDMDSDGAARLLGEIEKAQVRVKPHQWRGRLVSSYVQERQSKYPKSKEKLIVNISKDTKLGRVRQAIQETERQMAGEEPGEGEWWSPIIRDVAEKFKVPEQILRRQVLWQQQYKPKPEGIAPRQLVREEDKKVAKAQVHVKPYMRRGRLVSQYVREEQTKYVVDPAGIAESFRIAGEETEKHQKLYRDLTNQLPDGTNIKGWEKLTATGDVFWQRRKRVTANILAEVGQKAVDHALEVVRKEPTQYIVKLDKTPGPSTPTAEEPDERKIGVEGFKILEVIDTREYEAETDEKGRDVFKPVPGSGQENMCERCGKLHEVHYRVMDLATKKEHVVGSSCARSYGVVTKNEATNIERLAKNIKKLQSELANHKETYGKLKKIADDIAKMPRPPIEKEMKQDAEVKARPVTVWKMGASIQWDQSDTSLRDRPNDDILYSLEVTWKHNMMDKMAEGLAKYPWIEYDSLKSKIGYAEKDLKKNEKRMEALLNDKNKDVATIQKAQVQVRPYTRQGHFVQGYHQARTVGEEQADYEDRTKWTAVFIGDEVRRIPAQQPGEGIEDWYSRVQVTGIEEVGKTLNVGKIADLSTMDHDAAANNLALLKAELAGWHELKLDGKGDLYLSITDDLSARVHGEYGHKIMSGKNVLRPPTIYIGQKYVESLPHEYGHFLVDYYGFGAGIEETKGRFDESTGDYGESGLVERNLAQKTFWVEHKPVFETGGEVGSVKKETEESSRKHREQVARRWDSWMRDENRLAKKNFKMDNKPTRIAFRELLVVLKPFYTSEEQINATILKGGRVKWVGRNRKRVSWGAYFYKPTEIIARAIGFYANGKNNVTQEFESQQWKDIVTQWGDKYIKTGIVKSMAN